MGTLHAIAAECLLPLPKLSVKPIRSASFHSFRTHAPSFTRIGQRPGDLVLVAANSVSEELDAIPIQSGESTDQQEVISMCLETEGAGTEMVSQVGGFATSEVQFSFDGFSSSGSASTSSSIHGLRNAEMERAVDRTLNALIVLAAGSFAITKLLTIDHDYWHGWTLFEILRYAPQHYWAAYEEALKTNPIFAKMIISGVDCTVL